MVALGEVAAERRRSSCIGGETNERSIFSSVDDFGTGYSSPEVRGAAGLARWEHPELG